MVENGFAIQKVLALIGLKFINNVVSHLMHRTKLCTGRWQAEEKEGKWGRVKHGEAAQCGQPIEDRGCSVMRGGTGAVRRRGG